MSTKEPVKKIVFVGNGAVGKTSLLYAYKNQGGFRASYTPTIYDENETEVILDGIRYFIKAYDTAGQEDVERLRKMIYKEADCFVLCYSIVDRISYNKILEVWYPEVSVHDCPIVLVATKCDLTVGRNILQSHDGERMRKKINANAFIECSAKNNENINEVLYAAVRATINGPLPPPEEPTCCRCFSFFQSCFSSE